MFPHMARAMTFGQIMHNHDGSFTWETFWPCHKQSGQTTTIKEAMARVETIVSTSKPDNKPRIDTDYNPGLQNIFDRYDEITKQAKGKKRKGERT
jgi:hypothetical protein